MALFNLFKKKKSEQAEEPPMHMREFVSDAGKFTAEEISEFILKVLENPEILPPAKSDEYTAQLIQQLVNEPDIELRNDTTTGNIRTISLEVMRDNGPDYVALSYGLWDPNVVYVTTSPYAYAEPGLGANASEASAGVFVVREVNKKTCGAQFNNYSNQLMKNFPIIQVGAKDYPMEETDKGTIYGAVYAVRTFVPMLERDDDYANLLTATRSLPIYGYDLRDGFHSGDPQPYAGRDGLNIQLSQMLSMHELPNNRMCVPAVTALFGVAEQGKRGIEFPAVVTNAYLQEAAKELRYNESLFYANVDDVQIACHELLPNIWVIKSTANISIDSDKKVLNLFELMGSFNYPDDRYAPLGLYQMYINHIKDDVANVSFCEVCCVPNEVNAKAIGWQIAQLVTFNKRLKSN